MLIETKAKQVVKMTANELTYKTNQTLSKIVIFTAAEEFYVRIIKEQQSFLSESFHSDNYMFVCFSLLDAVLLVDVFHLCFCKKFKSIDNH